MVSSREVNTKILMKANQFKYLFEFLYTPNKMSKTSQIALAILPFSHM